MWYFNGLAFVIAVVASIYLFFIAGSTVKDLRKGFFLLAIGVFISTGIHSFVELMESLELISTQLLVIVMPILVFIGSSILLIGTITIYKVINSVKSGKR